LSFDITDIELKLVGIGLLMVKLKIILLSEFSEDIKSFQGLAPLEFVLSFIVRFVAGGKLS
jgi:hypothetical protein